MDALLTIPQVADLLAVHHKTVRKLVTTGRLDAFRVGGAIRIAQDAVKRFLHASKIKPPASEPVVVKKPRQPQRTFKFL
jgi:excisionase family DNA binding protein